MAALRLELRSRSRRGEGAKIEIGVFIAALVVLAGAACGDDATSLDDPESGTLQPTGAATSTMGPGSNLVPEPEAPTGPAELEGDLRVGTAIYDVLPPGPSADRFALTVTLPEGWSGADGWVLRAHGGVDDREGVAITFWSPPAVVYGDPCQWTNSAIEVEPSVDFMAEALAQQEMRNASTPREFHLGESRAVEIQLSVPDDLDPSMCDLYEGTPSFQSWASADGAVARYHQGPGQRDLVRLVDVDGELLIIDVATWPELPPAEHDEIAAVLDSMTFEVADR